MITRQLSLKIVKRHEKNFAIIVICSKFAVTITDSAIGLRCGAVTHAQTMAREVNGGCEYSDGNGWSLWTPMPCDPVIANGYPCSYCHKGHDTDIQREIHIETECPEYTTSCPKCHTTLLRKELANHQCSGISNSSDSNDSNQSGNNYGAYGGLSGNYQNGNTGTCIGGGGNKGLSTFPEWCGGDLEIPKNIKTVQKKLPAKVRHQPYRFSCFFASLANLYLLKNQSINWKDWDLYLDEMVNVYEETTGANIDEDGFDDCLGLNMLDKFGLEEIAQRESIWSLLDAGYPVLGGFRDDSFPFGHIITIVGYDVNNKEMLYCMNTDTKRFYGNYMEINIHQIKIAYKPLKK